MTEKSSIAFVCHPYHRGGVTRWMADAAVAATSKGLAVYFVTVAPVRPFVSSGGRETMLNMVQPFSKTVHIISQKVNFTFEFGTEKYRANIYSQLIKKNVLVGTPIIISDDMAIWSGACALADKYPIIGVLHGDQDYYYDRAKKYHKQLSVCVCVSGRIKRNLIAKCPDIDLQKSIVIPCGINLPEFKPSPQAGDTTRLIFIGRLTDYEKRAYDLVAICAELHKQGFHFHLDIVGNNDTSATEFGNNFKKNDVDTFITFHGWQPKDEIQKLLNQSDILLLTSNSEGMPIVLMEALASGCGFTGTHVSGIEDFEHDPRAADCLSVYTIGDIPDAVNKIKQVAAIPATQRQQGARKLAEAEFSMDICLGRYFKAISNIKTGIIATQTTRLSLTDMVYSKVIAVGRYLKTLMG